MTVAGAWGGWGTHSVPQHTHGLGCLGSRSGLEVCTGPRGWAEFRLNGGFGGGR